MSNCHMILRWLWSWLWDGGGFVESYIMYTIESQNINKNWLIKVEKFISFTGTLIKEIEYKKMIFSMQNFSLLFP
jgi:hypothetical protein